VLAITEEVKMDAITEILKKNMINIILILLIILISLFSWFKRSRYKHIILDHQRTIQKLMLEDRDKQIRLEQTKLQLQEAILKKDKDANKEKIQEIYNKANELNKERQKIEKDLDKRKKEQKTKTLDELQKDLEKEW